ncbi:MAG: FAD-dependent oxidoreductase, partial [Fimbriimonadales bacterium]
MERVIVVGAGVIGSAIALELHQRGVGTVLLESDSAGGQTSIASAGMVNPFSLTPHDSEAIPFYLASRDRYPQWVETVQQITGIDVGWRMTGSLRVALTDSECEHLQSMVGWVSRYEPQARLLNSAEVRELEPALSASCDRALYVPSEGRVQTERLMHALHSALRYEGVDCYWGQPVLGFVQEQGQVRGVVTATGTLYADAVVVASGAWSGGLLQSLGLAIPVQPVRGQTVLLTELPLPMRHIVVSPIGYLVPHADGTLLLGATREQAGFDFRATAEGFAHLLHTLSRLSPRLMHATLAGHTVGLRPG